MPTLHIFVVTAYPPLETARLLLHPLELADADQIQRKFPHPEIVRFLHDNVPWPYPPDGALSYIEKLALPAIREGRAWHWTIRRKELPSDVIGLVSLMRQPDDNRGFWLVPEWQGQGLMREASDAATDYWFGPLGEAVLRVPKATANIASRAISAGSGMRVIWTGERDYVSGRHPAELWEITSDEWASRLRTNQPRM
ncbi:MAG: GNAT family N-acetyltransferase [Sphingobium sp.]